MVSDQEIIEACRSSVSMSKACAKVGLHFNTFKGRAKKLGVYAPNKGGKGFVKTKGKIGKDNFSTEDILNGKHPQYQTGKLKQRLFNEGLKEKRCERCNLSRWLEKEIPLELNHIDGNRHNHSLDNLEILCPNCHAMTDTYRGKNAKKK